MTPHRKAAKISSISSGHQFSSAGHVEDLVGVHKNIVAVGFI
jgi:hypothetical protein